MKFSVEDWLLRMSEDVAMLTINKIIDLDEGSRSNSVLGCTSLTSQSRVWVPFV